MRVVGARREHSIVSQGLRDGAQARPRDVELEDAAYYGGGVIVGDEAVGSLAGGSAAVVGMWPGVHELVAVWGAAA